ncbi:MULTISPECIES: DUF924 family protein [unclassified Sphingopyxis]|uniref:DUF924 family protein n=1 Tax=unclassified Sphingopyxis TaxID=2614943 RepID=UPI00285C094A|nr:MULTISPECIES: DUF924 family protein [unclassified Sphingopyxis]MDR6833101.1 uncharacterized protein (DUF924 family) [Sphingopyxis sp. BE122]MDR7228844.1 uncharacterized protein (DUF924 family) [Sphingopyxis sp. BE259]
MTNALETPATPPTDWAQQLLAFWFVAHGHDDWYRGGADFDKAVRDLAEGWHEALRSRPAEAFLTDPDTALAAAILFDQVPRNIFRGHADAFATDPLARAIARGIVEKGWDQAWPDERRQFAYLPFEHSEDIADQRESLRLMGQLADPMFLDYAQKHFDIIDRFGRFPHRNEALGRATRDDEAEAIEAGKNW